MTYNSLRLRDRNGLNQYISSDTRRQKMTGVAHKTGVDASTLWSFTLHARDITSRYLWQLISVTASSCGTQRNMRRGKVVRHATCCVGRPVRWTLRRRVLVVHAPSYSRAELCNHYDPWRNRKAPELIRQIRYYAGVEDIQNISGFKAYVHIASDRKCSRVFVVCACLWQAARETGTNRKI